MVLSTLKSFLLPHVCGFKLHPPVLPFLGGNLRCSFDIVYCRILCKICPFLYAMLPQD